MLILAAVALALWLAMLGLPSRPWGCAERLEPDGGDGAPVAGVTVLVPARNEAAVIGETLGALAFCVPVIAVGVGGADVCVLGVLAWLALGACYVPMLRYYRRTAWAALLLPLAATFFLAMTWYSALRALAGTRSEWKGRRYRRGAH